MFTTAVVLVSLSLKTIINAILHAGKFTFLNKECQILSPDSDLWHTPKIHKYTERAEALNAGEALFAQLA